MAKNSKVHTAEIFLYGSGHKKITITRYCNISSGFRSYNYKYTDKRVITLSNFAQQNIVEAHYGDIYILLGLKS